MFALLGKLRVYRLAELAGRVFANLSSPIREPL